MAEVVVDIQAALARPGPQSSDFDLNPDVELPENRKLRPAAVLIPLIERRNETQVILTKRSSRLKHHPGQIAFPGGKVDQSDKDSIDAALREAEEEIGLPRDIVLPLGLLASHETVTQFCVVPVVAQVLEDFSPSIEAREVDEMFEVPLKFLADPGNYTVQNRMWQGRRRNYYTVPYGPYYIWGATARILRGLAERMAT